MIHEENVVTEKHGTARRHSLTKRLYNDTKTVGENIKPTIKSPCESSSRRTASFKSKGLAAGDINVYISS